MVCHFDKKKEASDGESGKFVFACFLKLLKKKLYQFAPEVLTINEAVEDLNFVADNFR